MPGRGNRAGFGFAAAGADAGLRPVFGTGGGDRYGPCAEVVAQLIGCAGLGRAAQGAQAGLGPVYGAGGGRYDRPAAPLVDVGDIVRVAEVHKLPPAVHGKGGRAGKGGEPHAVCLGPRHGQVGFVRQGAGRQGQRAGFGVIGGRKGGRKGVAVLKGGVQRHLDLLGGQGQAHGPVGGGLGAAGQVPQHGEIPGVV